MAQGLNVVLVSPEIPPNTGNIGRLCVATQSRLHLVGPLGFDISDAQVKRAGLDYWQYLDLIQHETLAHFWDQLPEQAPLAFLSKKAQRPLFEHSFQPGSFLIFGNETSGLPEELLKKNEERSFKIPMSDNRVRSLNLSTAVGIAVYEAIRQLEY